LLAGLAGVSLNGEAAELQVLEKRSGVMFVVKSATDRATFTVERARSVLMHQKGAFWSQDQAWRRPEVGWDKAAEARRVLCCSGANQRRVQNEAGE
jgi:hypothetical protein